MRNKVYIRQIKESDSVVISGCSRGLGYHLLLEYLSNGWIVYPIVRDASSIKNIRSEFDANCRPIICDITRESAGESISGVLSKHTANLSLVINNAGLSGKGISLSKIDCSNLNLLLSTHCMGAICVTQACQPFLVDGQSKIVNISSRLGSAHRNAKMEFMGHGFSYTYRIAKAAQNMASLCMSQDQELQNCIVCSIHPGRLMTETAAYDADTDPADAAKRLKEKIDSLEAGDNGKYFDLDADEIPW